MGQAQGLGWALEVRAKAIYTRSVTLFLSLAQELET